MSFSKLHHDVQRQPGATGGTAAQCQRLTSQAALPAAQWQPPRPHAPSSPAPTPDPPHTSLARLGFPLWRDELGRHVTHLRRLSPERTCKRTQRPGARRAERHAARKEREILNCSRPYGWWWEEEEEDEEELLRQWNVGTIPRHCSKRACYRDTLTACLINT